MWKYRDSRYLLLAFLFLFISLFIFYFDFSSFSYKKIIPTCQSLNEPPSSFIEIIKVEEKYYLIRDCNMIHEVQDRETVEYLGYDPEHVKTESSSILENYQLGEKIILRIISHLDVELEKISILQESVFEDVRLIEGSYYNPSLIKWKNRIFLIGQTLDKMNSNQRGDNNLKFSWVHEEPYEFTSDEQFLCLSDSPIKLSRDIIGEDARVIELQNGNLRIFYSSNMDQSIPDIGTADIYINSNNCIDVLEVQPKIYWKSAYVIDHCNWAPFIYEGKVLAVQNIFPFIVADITNGKSANELSVSSINNAENIHWDYGRIRGSTNAVYIGNDKYLAFFHSNSKVLNNELKTYFFGAYTFTSKPPFKLLQISRFPLIDPLFYRGEYDKPGSGINYIIMPTTCYLESNNTIVVSGGWNERAGFISYINLDRLLSTLVTVVDH